MDEFLLLASLPLTSNAPAATTSESSVAAMCSLVFLGFFNKSPSAAPSFLRFLSLRSFFVFAFAASSVLGAASRCSCARSSKSAMLRDFCVPLGAFLPLQFPPWSAYFGPRNSTASGDQTGVTFLRYCFSIPSKKAESELRSCAFKSNTSDCKAPSSTLVTNSIIIRARSSAPLPVLVLTHIFFLFPSSLHLYSKPKPEVSS
mmetsp:Transcript_116446/g.182010  ORF Transcript_116446/g.182010 Transcript_116446/m.182010 type:complete len:202 (-) Transcript_116446:42-647(-)